MDVRRVVTGHDATGTSVFVSDTAVAPYEPAMMPGAAFHLLWGADGAPTFPGDGSLPPHHDYFPPVGGVRFGFFTLPPAGTVPPAIDDMAAALADFEGELPGMLAHMEPDNPGMHTTSTLDFEVVLSGEVTLELDEGNVVTLKPGDTVVQNGTRHRWANPGSVPAVIAVFLTGAHRR